MSRASADTGRYLAETFALLRKNFGLAAAAFLILTGFDVGSDAYGLNAAAFILASLLFGMLFQYEFTLIVLSRAGLAERRKRRRFWALVAMNILSGVAILLAFLLLLMPGLYLFVRWSLAAPILLAEDAGPLEALSRSAQELSGRFWPVAGLFLLLFLPLLGALVAAFFLADDETLFSSLVLNVPTNLSMVAGWFGAVAVYSDGRRGEQLAEVFA
jgi:hypothetical protein